VNGFSLDIALIFIPGLVCAKLYFTLTSFRRPGYLEMAGYSLVFGFLCYLVWSTIAKALVLIHQICCESIEVPGWGYIEGKSAISRLIDPGLSLRSSDITGALFVSVLVAFVTSWLKHRRTLFKVSGRLRASLRYSTDSVFVEFSKLAQNQYIRIWKSENLAYEGIVHLFYEHIDMYEVVLTQVEIIRLDDDPLKVGDTATNPLAYLYVRWNKADDVLLEIPEDNGNQEQHALNTAENPSGIQAFAARATEWLRASWPRTRKTSSTLDATSSTKITAQIKL